MGMKGGRHCLMTYKEVSITENVNHYDVRIMVKKQKSHKPIRQCYIPLIVYLKHFDQAD